MSEIYQNENEGDTMKYRITLTDDTIAELARRDASTIAEAIKIARRLSGGRQLLRCGVSYYVDGPNGRAWIV